MNTFVLPRVVVDVVEDLVERATAVFDPDRTYRYELTRRWAPGPVLLFVMLNSSTATAHTLDPTASRCRTRAIANRFGAVRIVNLYALRATDPTALDGNADPVGPDNDRILSERLSEPDQAVVCAWGSHPMAVRRAGVVLDLIHAAGHRPLCLGYNADGHPRHPLYVLNAAPLITYNPAPGVNVASPANGPQRLRTAASGRTS